MLKLKQLSEITHPDPRQLLFVRIAACGPKKNQMSDFYDAVKTLELHSGVPSDVQYHFDIARHLFIYAWFYYPFGPMADFHAYIAVETALKRKTGKTKASLKTLLKEAVANKWITDEQFTVYNQRTAQAEAERARAEELGMEPSESPSKKSYAEQLCESIPFFRNTHAHGEVCLMPTQVTTLRTCSELINQLFERP